MDKNGVKIIWVGTGVKLIERETKPSELVVLNLLRMGNSQLLFLENNYL
jgi:hypothetical protein